jgi:hypothetical protein
MLPSAFEDFNLKDREQKTGSPFWGRRFDDGLGKCVDKMPTLLELFSSDGWLIFGEFGDVDEAIFTREHFHESAELGGGNHLAHFELLEHGRLSTSWRG